MAKHRRIIDNAIAGNDLKEAADALHTIKGSLGNLGGDHAAEIAQLAETAALADNLEGLKAELQNFDQAFAGFMSEFSEFFKELQS